MEGCQKGQQAQRSWPPIVAMYTYTLILILKKVHGQGVVLDCAALNICQNVLVFYFTCNHL